MEKKPTDQEIKELWKKCGFAIDGVGIWHCPDKIQELGTRTPPIDLNTLFKYAVPRYIDKIKAGVSSNYIGNAYARLFEQWQKELFFTHWEDPADALFLVISKVFKEA